MSSSYDKVIFKDVTLADLFAEIHTNSVRKKKQIDDIIAEANSVIESTEDVIAVSPIIKDYLEVSVKNIEHLIKLAGIIQRSELASITSDGIDSMFNPEELQKLLEDSEQSLPSIPKNEQKSE